MATKTKQHPTMGTTTEFIPPEIAAEYISQEKRPTNRRVSKMHVDDLAHSMQTGQWLEEALEPIIFDNARHLIDGRHRMWALIETGQSHFFQVARGLASETIWVLDTGRRRTIPDFLSVAGERNCKALAAAIKTFAHWTKTGSLAHPGRNFSSLTPQEAFRILEAHPGLRESTIKGSAVGRAIGGGSGRWAGIHYVLSQIDQEDADDLVDRAAHGDYLHNTHPIFQLRKRALENILNKQKMTPSESAVLICKAWDMYRRGKTTHNL